MLAELIKNSFHRAEEPDLHFWRDSTGHEIDLLIERGRNLTPVEIKSGETVAGDYFPRIFATRALISAAPASSPIAFNSAA